MLLPFSLLVTLLIITQRGGVDAINCTVCEFMLKPVSRDCNDTCTGDVCFIVTSPHFNATINAGCFNLREGDNFTGKAVCGRTSTDVRCVCDTDLCNSPGEKIDEFTFGTVALSEYQYVPQIEPPRPGPVPPEGVPVPLVPISNETEESTESPSKRPMDPEMIVTKTVGFQVRNESAEVTSTEKPAEAPGMTTKGVGSVQADVILSTSQPRNSSLVVAQEDPNGSHGLLPVSLITLLFYSVFYRL